MAFRGQVLINPVSGERFVFHTTADESRGELLEFDTVIEPHGRVPGGHVHPGQQESFEVRAGVMRFRKGLRTVTAGPGDLVVVEPGTYHRFANAGDAGHRPGAGDPGAADGGAVRDRGRAGGRGPDSALGHAPPAGSGAVHARVRARGRRPRRAGAGPDGDGAAGGDRRAPWPGRPLPALPPGPGCSPIRAPRPHPARRGPGLRHPPIPRPPGAVPARRARGIRPAADGRPARVRPPSTQRTVHTGGGEKHDRVVRTPRLVVRTPRLGTRRVDLDRVDGPVLGRPAGGRGLPDPAASRPPPPAKPAPARPR